MLSEVGEELPEGVGLNVRARASQAAVKPAEDTAEKQGRSTLGVENHRGMVSIPAEADSAPRKENQK